MDFIELENINVLYVEDEDIIRHHITEMLQEVCNKVFTAKDGESGYQLFKKKQEHIDIVISDIQMPTLSGLDMARKIREITHEVPIIFTTAFSDSSYLFDSINIGIDAYIEKPVEIMYLFKTMKKTLLPFLQREKILKEAYTDKLTGIKNRSALDLQLEKNLHTAFILFDISGFKTINDLYGTENGNYILKEFAEFLNKQKRKNWDLYRIGSDDFGFLIYSDISQADCAKYLKKFFEALKNYSIYHAIYTLTININARAGVVIGTNEVLQRADMALNAAKSQKVDYLFYEKKYDYSKSYENDILWINKIDIAIKTNNIIPYFQPIVDKNKKIIKFECLMRLCEDGKAHSPYFFLEIAKKSTIYKELTMIVLKQIFETAVKFSQHTFAINLSHMDIIDDDTVNFIITNIGEKNIASRIIFEILEDEVLEDKERFFNFVDAVRALGSKIAIDDFGTGYANFSYVLEIQPDILKLDGSLIKDIDKNENHKIVSEAIINFTKRLGIETVAEYIHSEEVFEVSKTLGIDCYQGFLFSEAVPASEIDKLAF